MNLEIREIRQQHVFEISKIYVDALKNEYGNFIPDEVLNVLSIEKEAEDCKNRLSNNEKFYFILVAVIDKKIVGFIEAGSNTVEPFEYDCEVSEIFVKKEFQGLGIGLQLLVTASIKLKSNGYKQILIYNFHESKSNNFYRNLGPKTIKKIEQNYNGKTLDVDVFGWKIDSLIEVVKIKSLKYVNSK
jgi:L-amino acid N-acyltransferase YncA